VQEFGKIARESNTVIIPSTLSDLGGMVASVTSLLKGTGKTGGSVAPGA